MMLVCEFVRRKLSEKKGGLSVTRLISSSAGDLRGVHADAAQGRNGRACRIARLGYNCRLRMTRTSDPA